MRLILPPFVVTRAEFLRLPGSHLPGRRVHRGRVPPRPTAMMCMFIRQIGTAGIGRSSLFQPRTSSIRFRHWTVTQPENGAGSLPGGCATPSVYRLRPRPRPLMPQAGFPRGFRHWEGTVAFRPAPFPVTESRPSPFQDLPRPRSRLKGNADPGGIPLVSLQSIAKKWHFFAKPSLRWSGHLRFGAIRHSAEWHIPTPKTP
jgi:hypothetical protein